MRWFSSWVCGGAGGCLWHEDVRSAQRRLWTRPSFPVPAARVPLSKIIGRQRGFLPGLGRLFCRAVCLASGGGRTFLTTGTFRSQQARRLRCDVLPQGRLAARVVCLSGTLCAFQHADCSRAASAKRDCTCFILFDVMTGIFFKLYFQVVHGWPLSALLLFFSF